MFVRKILAFPFNLIGGILILGSIPCWATAKLFGENWMKWTMKEDNK